MRIEYMHPADQLLAIMDRIYYGKMTTTSGGNLSIKDSDGNIWITPASIDKGTLTRQDIVCVHPGGFVEGIHNPSSELPFHASVYRRRPDLSAVLHAHPPGLVAFSCARILPNLELLPQVKSLIGKVVLSDYAVPGSEKLGENIAKWFDQGYNTVFLENHGVCIGSDNIFEAFRRFETLEYTCNLEIAARRLGNIKSSSRELLEASKAFDPASLEEFVPGVPSQEELAARRDMIPFLRRSYKQKLCISTLGDYSVKLSDGSILITPEGKDRNLLDEADLVLVKDGKREAGKVPGASIRFHQAAYARRPEARACILGCPGNLMAFAVTDTVFDARTIPESYLLLRDIVKVPGMELYTDPVKAASHFTNPQPAIIFENIGLAVTGTTLLQAFDRYEVADATANSILLAGAVGEIVHIHKEEVDEIKQVFHLED